MIVWLVGLNLIMGWDSPCMYTRGWKGGEEAVVDQAGHASGANAETSGLPEMHAALVLEYGCANRQPQMYATLTNCLARVRWWQEAEVVSSDVFQGLLRPPSPPPKQAQARASSLRARAPPASTRRTSCLYLYLPVSHASLAHLYVCLSACQLFHALYTSPHVCLLVSWCPCLPLSICLHIFLFVYLLLLTCMYKCR
jgi:hypothetical protein